CGPTEDCENCPEDCGECCGNGTCEPARGEDCATCSADCGSCCGNGTCEPGFGETCTSCPGDCGPCVCGSCGDGFCVEPVESATTCPSDCDANDPCGGDCSGFATVGIFSATCAGGPSCSV